VSQALLFLGFAWSFCVVFLFNELYGIFNQEMFINAELTEK